MFLGWLAGWRWTRDGRSAWGELGKTWLFPALEFCFPHVYLGLYDTSPCFPSPLLYRVVKLVSLSARAFTAHIAPLPCPPLSLSTLSTLLSCCLRDLGPFCPYLPPPLPFSPVSSSRLSIFRACSLNFLGLDSCAGREPVMSLAVAEYQKIKGQRKGRKNTIISFQITIKCFTVK